MKRCQTYPFDLLIKQMATNSSQYGTLMALLKKVVVSWTILSGKFFRRAHHRTSFLFIYEIRITKWKSLIFSAKGQSFFFFFFCGKQKAKVGFLFSLKKPKIFYFCSCYNGKFDQHSMFGCHQRVLGHLPFSFLLCLKRGVSCLLMGFFLNTKS